MFDVICQYSVSLCRCLCCTIQCRCVAACAVQYSVSLCRCLCCTVQCRCVAACALQYQCVAVSLPVLYSTVCRCVTACAVQYTVSSHYISSSVAVTVPDF